jgi:leucyl-tRNA synthetase
LSRAPDSWKHVDRDGVTYTRELNTMPQWAGSCWYYLRFIDPRNGDRFVGEEPERYWMSSRKKDGKPHSGGVDLYVGGAEHAVLHLLYARFWHKVLYDLGHVCTPEPFCRLFNQGYIQAYAYTDDRGVYVPAEQIEEKDGRFFHEGRPVRQEKLGKMGKSLKNAVAPDEMCERFGCDSLRLYEMYLGPLDQDKAWSTKDVVGQHRFLNRLWRNFVDEETGQLLVSDDPPGDDLRKKLHRTIKRVTDDVERFGFNTAIAALIELNNDLVAVDRLPRQVAETVVLLLSPMAPHIAEELWQRLGHNRSLAYEPWPDYDEDQLAEDRVEYPVQVNGKLRGKIMVAADADDEAIRQAALSDPKVAGALDGKSVRKVIVVKGRLVNFVVG